MPATALSPAIESSSALHRARRRATLTLLVAGAGGALALVAWSLIVRWTQTIEDVGRPGIASGLKLAAQLDVSYLGLAGVSAVVATALAYAIAHGKRGAYLAIAAGGAGLIAAVWYARAFVVRLEYPGYVSKSPWVGAATTVAIAVTAYLAAMIATALLAWIVSRRPPTRDPR